MPQPTDLPTDIGSLLSLFAGLGGRGQWDAIANRADPWGPQRGQYQDQLNAFMKDPSSVLKDPAFLAAEQLGSENISRQSGAAGMAGSGNRLADLFKYGQTSGLAFEDQKFKQLEDLAGVNAGSPAAAAGIEAQGLQTQGTNLATGLAGVIPLISQLLGLGGSAAGGIGDMFKGLFGGSGGGGSSIWGGGPESDITKGIFGDFNNPNNPLTGGPPDYMYGFDNPPTMPDWASLFGGDTGGGIGDLGGIFGGLFG